MKIQTYPTKEAAGKAAAEAAAGILRETLAQQNEARLILATGASQLEMLSHLTRADVEWPKVTVFHLDEYIGLPSAHPASFRKYLKERFAAKVRGLKAFHYVNGEAPGPAAECIRLGKLIRAAPVDAACVGIGENGHLAFNDPPADFETEEPYLVVELDEACRRQQMGEGWFPALGEVPRKAISMSIRQIMKSRAIVCTVPDERKARAVQAAVESPVTPEVPASILQRHPGCQLFLDAAAASLLKKTNG